MGATSSMSLEERTTGTGSKDDGLLPRRFGSDHQAIMLGRQGRRLDDKDDADMEEEEEEEGAAAEGDAAASGFDHQAQQE